MKAKQMANMKWKELNEDDNPQVDKHKHLTMSHQYFENRNKSNECSVMSMEIGNKLVNLIND